MTPIEIIAVFVGVLCLIGCSRNEPAGSPISMAQPGDEQLSCPEINAQMKVNRSAMPADSYRREMATGAALGGAITGGLAGGLVAGVIAAKTADQTDVGKVKARSLVDRNERLAFLSRSKGCRES